MRIPRAVLTDRLTTLTEAGVLRRVSGGGRREVYELTSKGVSLWPVVGAITAWGDEHYAPGGPRRIFRHAADNAPVSSDGRCTNCAATVGAEDTLVTPGPGLTAPTDDDDLVTAALTRPHRLLQPLRD
ncbi:MULTISPECIES: winged helix-turn-helix transcriptional regulator [unclassified Streptomyces]|uniref:winged helix-turn-helix transcriptional regulator n=1 Tax=unclassified Streptomyces TaxID=2593676 RepID=UPI00386C97CD